jgi:hypothetical protein
MVGGCTDKYYLGFFPHFFFKKTELRAIFRLYHESAPEM